MTGYKNRITIGDRTFDIVVRFLLLLFVVISFYPFFWMITNSFKGNKEIYLSPISLPTTFDLSVFRQAWEKASFTSAFLNSIVATTTIVVIIVFAASFAAFSMARMRYKGRNLFLSIFIACQIVSAQIVLVPLFSLFLKLQLFDKLLSIIFAKSAFGIPLSVFLFWSFFKDIPQEIDESTRIDGCPSLTFFFKILLPLSKPVFATVIIFESLFSWNEFLFALTFLKSPPVLTIPIRLHVFFSEFTTEWGMLFAALSIAVVPILIIYLFMQKSFIKGLTEGAVKG